MQHVWLCATLFGVQIVGKSQLKWHCSAYSEILKTLAEKFDHLGWKEVSVLLDCEPHVLRSVD